MPPRKKKKEDPATEAVLPTTPAKGTVASEHQTPAKAAAESEPAKAAGGSESQTPKRTRKDDALDNAALLEAKRGAAKVSSLAAKEVARLQKENKKLAKQLTQNSEEKTETLDQAESIILKPCRVRGLADRPEEMTSTLLINKYGLRSTAGELVGFKVANADLNTLGLPLLMKNYESMDANDWINVLAKPAADREYVPQPLVRSVVVDYDFEANFRETGTFPVYLVILISALLKLSLTLLSVRVDGFLRHARCACTLGRGTDVLPRVG
jgi:hypothetical protein